MMRSVTAALSGFLLRGGDFSFNHAIGLGYTTVVAPIAGAYPSLLTLLGFLFFKDPVSRQQWCGILLALTGILSLGYFSAML